VLKVAKWCLFLTALTPLIITNEVYFPFVLGKMVWYRSLTELALALLFGWLAWAIITKHEVATPLLPGFTRVKDFLKSPTTVATLVFFVSLALSVIFAVNGYRAFWGDIERAEGFFGMLHYLGFAVAALLLFERKDWTTYFKFSVGVGFVLAFYAFLQWAGVESFPFARPSQPRADSFIGNAAFLATHMFFFALFAWFLTKEPSKWWRIAAFLAIPVSILIMFFTGTRGAILGVGAAIVAFLVGVLIRSERWRGISLRMGASVLLAVIAVGTVGFWVTRDAALWQKVPGLDRLARTATLDKADASTQVRLITWRVSWEAFKEKPVFGWGPENYLVAYEKHYDPDYAIYGETWLDRAHNKFFDLLVMQGIVGVLTYIALIITLLATAFRRTKHLFVPLFVFVVGYSVQNLVLFDQIVSYATFFALLAFVIHESTPLVGEAVVPVSPRARLGIASGGVVLVVLMGISLYAWNAMPYAQAKALLESPKLGDIQKVIGRVKDGFYPYNFAQYTLRGQAIDTVYLDQFFYHEPYRTKESFKPLGELLLEGMDEIIRREPYDVRIMLRYVEMLDALSREDESLYPKMESVLRVAREIAPHRQEVLYHLAANLAKQGKVEEGLAVAREAVALSPEVPRAHFYLSLILAAAGEDEEGKQEILRAEELSPDFSGFLSHDHNTFMMLYQSWGMRDKVAALALRSAQGPVRFSFNTEYYYFGLGFFAEQRDAESFIAIADYLKEIDKGNAESLDILIDLARNGNWNIIETL